MSKKYFVLQTSFKLKQIYFVLTIKILSLNISGKLQEDIFKKAASIAIFEVILSTFMIFLKLDQLVDPDMQV